MIFLCFYPFGKAGGFHIPCCQGIAVKDYGVTLGALALKPSRFCNVGVQKEEPMAGGWSRDGAVQDQIDASVEDAVKLARSRLPDGESFTYCEQCEAAIPAARRKAMRGVRLCVSCQSDLEEKQTAPIGINRRAGKDSQLK
jgi:phage/conjugal plasmid C-4 type zinc finger TraR family protein